jgi:hypothetical protein
MKFIGFERELEAIEWAKAILGIAQPTGFCRAFSAVNAEDDFVFVVVLSNFTNDGADMHTASFGNGKWATPDETIKMFNAVFGYAFEHLKMMRITGLVAASNAKARKFDEHLGFVLEGTMRKALRGEDLCIYGFLAEDYFSHPWYRSIK